jgi:hypothetical protein
MELAFNVAWGPLTQIAVPFIDIKAAVELAVGAYGWWKARERTLSLMEMIKSEGGRLTPSFSFNVARYLAAPQLCQFRAIASVDGRLEAVALPNASTANIGDAGANCLRAIVTALLALYDVATTTEVLAYVIPRCLINYDLEGEHPEAVGPFLQSVRHYVKGVADEELCSTTRKQLHTYVDEEYRTLFPENKFRIKNVQDIEIPLIIGLLEWILMAPSKRSSAWYRTRSLTVWSLSIMLSRLGFDIGTTAMVVTTEKLYDEYMSSLLADPPFEPEVALTTCAGRATNLSVPIVGNPQRRRGSLSCRVVPIKAVPIVVF